MRKILFLLLLFVGNLTLAQTEYDEMLKEYYKNTVPTISPAKLYAKMQKGETIHILDTRMKKEYAVSHLQNAVHVGFLAFNTKNVSEIKKTETIIVYCTIGARSETIGEKIQENGFTNVYNLYGGIIEWVNKGFPVYDNEKKETQNVHVYSKDWGKWLKKGTAVY